MNERIYFLFIGLSILFALYFEIEMLIYLICLLLMLEAVSNFRVSTFSQNFFKINLFAGLTAFNTKMRFNIDSFLVWRILVAIMLGGSVTLLNYYNLEVIWFVPWFMGFAILFAGMSGICPALLAIRWIGFR